jgi:hypothetical protein
MGRPPAHQRAASTARRRGSPSTIASPAAEDADQKPASLSFTAWNCCVLLPGQSDRLVANAADFGTSASTAVRWSSVRREHQSERSRDVPYDVVRVPVTG